MGTIDLDGIAAALAVHGLIARGAIALGPDETAPAGPSGAPAKSVLLIGHAGSSIWPHFSAWRASQPPGLADPLDTWSRLVIGQVAKRFGARAVSPSDRPYLPFQQWAMRAEHLRPSPLGILIHPEYGLWHAWRGALLFDDPGIVGVIADGQHEPPDHPCDDCAEKPCRKACPVSAHAGDPFDHAACLAHVRAPAGRPCLSGGCLDRDACPVGTAYRYAPAHRTFHMRAYAAPPSLAGAPPAR